MPTFNEDNTIEQLVIASLKNNGWKYIDKDHLPREYTDVMVEPMVKEAFCHLFQTDKNSLQKLTF